LTNFGGDLIVAALWLRLGRDFPAQRCYFCDFFSVRVCYFSFKSRVWHVFCDYVALKTDLVSVHDSDFNQNTIFICERYL